MTVSSNDREVLRDLAKRYMELCGSDRNKGLIEEWRLLNNMQPCRPMIHVNDGLLGDEIEARMPARRVEENLLRGAERRFTGALEWGAWVGDDRVFEPWLTVEAPRFVYPEGNWGVAKNRVHDESSRGWRNMPVLTTIDDLRKLKATEHKVLDPDPPRAQLLREVIGDIIPIHVSRKSIYGVWGGTDLCQPAGELFGLEELLMDLYTEPEMIHEFMTFARDAVLANLKQGEAAADWSAVDSWYYRTPAYCDELPDPEAGKYTTTLKDVAWAFHAQEFDGVSPEMFEEFLLNYQLPIMEKFGRVVYGCCETLDTKLDVLKKVPNMTKVLSGPRSDPAFYPEAYGDKCVISWRPVTTIIASEQFNEEAQRKQLREGLAKLRGCNIEVFLHEPMTVHGDLERVRTWVKIAREEAEGCQ